LTSVGTPENAPGEIGRRESPLEVGVLDRVQQGIDERGPGDRGLGRLASADRPVRNDSGDPDRVEVAECVVAEGVDAGGHLVGHESDSKVNSERLTRGD
jgi:hypothetical protein